jgi:phospholipase/carboxylesterase
LSGHHDKLPSLSAGPESESASAIIIMLHGRGASAEDMIGLYRELNVPEIGAVVPQATGYTWYPQSFLAPLAANQPFLDDALSRIENEVEKLLQLGVPVRQIVLLGFSQGACLASEYVARYPRSYGALMAITGGLIGPLGTPRNYGGRLDGVTAFLGTGDPDPHVPFERVKETANVLTSMGASVELRRYPGIPHSIVEDEISRCREILLDLSNSSSGVKA